MLELHGIDAGYGDIQVLFELSITIQEGSAVGLLGRNGAGKSTVFRTIVGLIQPSSGSVLYRGEDITGLPPHAISSRGIALVPAERRIFPNLTVLENLKLAQEGLNGTDEEVDMVFEMFPSLQGVKGNLGQDLSGGQQQMIAIGRGLIGDTDLLLLDEPIEGLAPQYVDRIIESLDDIRAMGKSILLIDHNIKKVLETVDEAYILKNGQVAHHGKARDILRDDDIIDDHFGLSIMS